MTNVEFQIRNITEEQWEEIRKKVDSFTDKWSSQEWVMDKEEKERFLN